MLAKLRWFGGNSSECLTLAQTNDPNVFKMVEITWWYYITKYIELADTIFFVLRKKENQLSKLHLIHHSGVPLGVWMLLRFEPGGYNTFFAQANAFVHCVMYTYYAMSAFGEEMKEHLWFKKYVTMTQMIQFILVLLYFFSRSYYGCAVSSTSFFFNIFLAGFFFVLFSNFYYHAYLETKSNGSLCHMEKPRQYTNGTKATKKVL